MKIELLCTGDEILSGKTINTNYSFIARRLVENGFTVCWGTTVGDDRSDLMTAFAQAAERADFVIVNGGLGPTVDDLSQEVAAQAAGVGLVLHEEWLERMRAWYTSRGRVMPDNNEKQAMLPDGAEFIDNPIGTACGFAVTINNARFFFTPGVPKEMRRMIDEQILPRLQKARGYEVFTRVKRFHTFGIGESRADLLLKGIEEMVEGGAVKLGFQSHYPQLETKLTVQGGAPDAIDRLLSPVETAVRERFGDFILAEDDQTLEGQILESLSHSGNGLAIVETLTGGSVTERLMRSSNYQGQIKQSLVSEESMTLLNKISKDDDTHDSSGGVYSQEMAISLARGIRNSAKTSHGIAILMSFSKQPQDREAMADVFIGIVNQEQIETRHARLPGSREWSRLGAAELALDCLRRILYKLPVYQRIDFEQH